MPILLPPQPDGTRLELPDNTGQITIIGANGAGKTRFSNALMATLSPGSFRLSALDALYASTADGNAHPVEAGSINDIYLKEEKSPAFLHNNATTTFDRLMALLLNEEISTLVEYKSSRDRDPSLPLPKTKLDTVVRSWQEIFTDNHILRDGGRLLFSREGESDTYSQKRLSDGEKTVLYFIGAALYAPENGSIFVDNPGMFLHPSILQHVWDTIEALRPDCRFFYVTHDIDFAASRNRNSVIWVQDYDAANSAWNYSILPSDTGISDEIYFAIIGARKPVLFIEGDSTHSIDAKLYPLIFREFTVKSLGSCNKVIEATRTFNDLRSFHHLDSRGIVDRDRRDEGEVAYLRGKKIFVPEVAEIENILMLEDVIRAAASFCEVDENKVFKSVRKSIMGQFKNHLRQQALMHTRHRVKRTVEYRVDGRFVTINDLEEHMRSLVKEINPRGLYEQFCRDFYDYLNNNDYASVLKVYNQKSMIPGSNVGGLLGLGTSSKDAYVRLILSILKQDCQEADRIRNAVFRCFSISPAEPE